MQAGQKGYGLNSLQNALFPFDEMYITQGENTGSSHVGMDAIDFVGWNPNTGQIYNYPYYAPFDCKLVAYFYEMIVWESLNPVNRIDGTTGIVTIGFGHDNDRSLPVGTIKYQGDLIGHTGTYSSGGGSVGDHCHMEVVNGTYAGFEVVPATGYYKMKNSVHIYNYLGVNDTTIYRGLNYNWRSFANNTPTPPTPPVPPTTRTCKFPWVLFARKFRERR